MSVPEKNITLDNIVATDEYLAEMSDGHPVIKISKNDITKVVLKRTLAAERPVVQSIFGIGACLIGIHFLRVMISRFIHAETVYIDVSIAMTLFIPIGIWFTIFAFRKRLLLHVHTSNDTRKLVFHKKTTSVEVETFIEKVTSDYNYHVENQIS